MPAQFVPCSGTTRCLCLRAGDSMRSTRGNCQRLHRDGNDGVRTPLMRALRRAVRDVTAESTDRSPARGGGRTRRRVLGSAAALGAGAGLAGLPSAPASAAAGREIVVIGAGLAGLTAAYRLRQAGVRATVYEATNRLG